MRKTYKGYKLVQAISEGKIKEGTKFKMTKESTLVDEKVMYNGTDLIYINSGKSIFNDYFFTTILHLTFTLLAEEKLYKFYLERKIDEINARLKHNLSYSIEHNTESIRADGWRFFDMSWTISVKIKISNIEIKKFTYVTHSNITKKDIYKAILRYINSKPISYFIKLDKKIEDLKKHNKELDDKKLNLEEELKKII